MDHRAIREALQARPFRPFRLRLNEGRVYDTLHPDYLWVGPNGRHVIHYDAADDDRMTTLEPLLIASLEYIQPAPPPTSNGSGQAGS